MQRILILLSLIGLLTVPARAQEPGDLELTSHLGGFIGNVTTEGSLGFVGRASVLHVLDLPALDNRAILPFEAETTVMTAGDNLLFVGFFGENILGIVDVTDPDAPTVASLTPLGDDTDRIGSLALVGDRLVVGALGANAGTLRILDVSDPAAPVELGSVEVPDLDVLVAGGTHAFVLGTVTLRVFDIANPAAPQEVATLNAASGSFEPPLALSGDRLYVRDTGPAGGLQIVDVSDPGDPALRGTFDAAPRPRGLAVLADRAYLNDGTDLVVLDVSDADAPTELGRLDLGVNIRMIDVFADGGSTKALVNGDRIVDATNPGNLIVERIDEQPELAGVLSVADDHLYVLDRFNGQVWRYAIKTGGALALQSRFEVQGVFTPQTMAVGEDLLITANNNREVNLFDLTIPDAPTPRGTLTLDIVPDRLHLRDGTLFAIGTNGTGKLVTVDVSNPDAPVVVGQMNLAGESRGLVVPSANAPNPDQIYVTFAGPTPGTGGLQVIDVTNPAAPDARSTTATPGAPRGIAVDGTLAVVGSSTAALDGWFLDAYDVSDGANPVHRAAADSVGSSVGAVAAVAGLILATFPEEDLMRSFRVVEQGTSKQGRFAPVSPFQEEEFEGLASIGLGLVTGGIIYALIEDDDDGGGGDDDDDGGDDGGDDDDDDGDGGDDDDDDGDTDTASLYIADESGGLYGVDVILGGLPRAGVTAMFDPDTGKLTITGDSNDTQITVATGDQGRVLINSDIVIDNFVAVMADKVKCIDVDGGDGDDIINLEGVGPSNFPNLIDELNINIVGGDGNDTIDGSEFGDNIDGGDGNDFVHGGGGDDMVKGGGGEDDLFGGDGKDTVKGGDGFDNMDGGDGDDTLEGGTGDDTIEGGDGDDTIKGGDDFDEIFGGDGEDTIFGGTGNDIINGGRDKDFILGGSGTDFINGDDGQDVIFAEGDNGDRNAPKTAPTNPLETALATEQILLGGTGNDSLFITALAVAQRIDGGEDTDVLMIDALGFAVTETDTTIFISGHEPIVFSGVETVLIADPSPVAVEDEADVPAAFALHSTYPNPFNPTTTIPYDVPAASAVTLEVYDVLGVRVGRLVEARQAPGRYQVAWQADHLASGVYFVRLVAEARSGRPFIAVQKVVLVK